MRARRLSPARRVSVMLGAVLALCLFTTSAPAQIGALQKLLGTQSDPEPLTRPSSGASTESPEGRDGNPEAPADTASEVATGPYEAAREELRSKQKALELAHSLSPAEKDRIALYIQESLGALDQLESMATASTDLAEELQAIPARQQEIQTLSRQSSRIDNIGEIAKRSTLEAAEAELGRAETELVTARQRLLTVTDSLAWQRNRPRRLRQQRAQAQEALVAIQAELGESAPEREAPMQSELRRASLLAREKARKAEIGFFEQDLASHDQRLNLATDEYDLAQRRVAALEANRDDWRTAVQRMREAAAARKSREAARSAKAIEQMPASIRKLADNNTALAEQLRTLTAKEAEVDGRATTVAAEQGAIEAALSEVQQRLELTGLNESMALVLRRRRDALPTQADYDKTAQKIHEEMGWATEIQINMQAIRREGTDAGTQARDLLAGATPAVRRDVQAFLLPQVAEALLLRQELVSDLSDGTARYMKALGRLENAEIGLVTEAQALRKIIDERLLWIRSTTVFDTESLRAAAEHAAELFSIQGWADMSGRVVTGAWTNVGLWIPGFGLVVLLVVFRPSANRYIQSTAGSIGRARRDSIRLTFKALVATVVLAAAWPMAFAAIWFPLSLSEWELDRSVGAGFLRMALIAMGIGLLSQLARKDGVLRLHFDWPEPALRTVRLKLHAIAPFMLGIGFLVSAVDEYDHHEIAVSLGRVLYFLNMLILSAFYAGVLHPSGPVMATLVERDSTTLLVRFRVFWTLLWISAPIALAVLSALGYHYSAMQLTDDLRATLWLLVLLLVVSETLMRWVYITERRVVYDKRVAERLEQRRLRKEGADQGPDDLDSTELAEPEISVEQVRKQAGTIIRSVVGAAAILGLWLIWASVLPALSVFRDVTLWHRVDQVGSTEQLVAVTFVDIALALLVAIVAWVGTRNLPGALELAILNRTSMEPGAKYAFTTLCRYVLAGAGIIAVFNILGMDWSKLGWMVAALSVGLGFGLQEIVANFISGIILLFERPIRVGDIVTVNGTDGVVARIQIRATTIVDFDRKEVLVPNKTLITGEVTNWTLTNATNRILIPVGVAYGSDTDLALRLLRKVAEDHPRVTDEPKPIATFEGFGDNTLNLVLRSYIDSIDGRLEVISELHAGIDQAYRAAGISIAFPQRDVHLDSDQPLEIRLLRERRPPPAPTGGTG